MPAPTPFCGEQVGLLVLFLSTHQLTKQSQNPYDSVSQCHAQRPYCKTLNSVCALTPLGSQSPRGLAGSSLLAPRSPRPGAEGFPAGCSVSQMSCPHLVLTLTGSPPCQPCKLFKQVTHIFSGEPVTSCYYKACFLWPLLVAACRRVQPASCRSPPPSSPSSLPGLSV